MTNHWVDIKNADLVMVMGGNAAEAHPCGFKWVIEAKKHRGAKLVVVDPRFNRSAAVSDLYVPIRSGSDIPFLLGVINYLLTHDRINHEYVRTFTNASYLIHPRFAFEDGLFSGYDEETRSYNDETWKYQVDINGHALTDPTLQHANCVLQLLKKHVAPYTPSEVARVSGMKQADYEKVLEMIGECSQPDKTMTILYALGWTQHSVGSQNIRTMAMVQLLLGNIGVAGGGINALRGHSNVQGITDMGLFGTSQPGYLSTPTSKTPTLQSFLAAKTPRALQPGQMNYWSNYSKFYVSLLKSYYGDNATPENDFGYAWMPKIDDAFDTLAMFERMHQGRMTGFFCQGFNPLASVSHKAKIGKALSNLKYLVSIDPLETETVSFWQPQGEYNDVKPEDVQTEVFRLPAVMFTEDEGSLTNSGRVIQWRWSADSAVADARKDVDILAALFLKLRELYADGEGAYAEPLFKVSWPYINPLEPSAEEIAREVSGAATRDITDPADPGKVLIKAGEQLSGFGQLRDDGSTRCGNWLYCGSWSEEGNLMARRDNSDPSGLGQTLNWGYAWPANRRILYNRASCDASGQPWDASRTVIRWNGSRWAGNDIPDMRANAAPEEGVGPFIMHPEGVSRLFAVAGMKDGPLPVHYEPFESPLTHNPMYPDNPRVKNNPVARIYPGDAENFGTPDQFPFVATTYRLVEHFHFWTKFARLNAITQPQQFVEIGPGLAELRGISDGDQVRVSSRRGEIRAVAVISKRISALTVDGQPVYTVGIPLHWGFKGLTRPGYLANTLTPYVGDANAQTPEFKAFLVNVEKV